MATDITKLSENAKNILVFLRDNSGDVTANDIGENLPEPLGVRSVVGSANSLVKKELITRSDEVEVVDEEGKKKKVKFLAITEEGIAALDELGI